MIMSRTLCAPIVLVMVLLGGGCGAARPEAARATSGRLEAKHVFRRGAPERVVQSPDGKLFQLRRTEAADSGGVWTLHLLRPAATPAASGAREGKVLKFSPHEGGAVSLASLEDFEKKTVTTFDPPLVLMPAVMGAGQVHTATASLVVREHRRPEAAGQAGSASVTTQLIAPGPGLVGVECIMRFEIAAAKVEQGRAYVFAEADFAGLPVREDEWLTVKVGMLTISRNKFEWVPAAAQ
jgi:hypothetical protein